MTVHSCVLYVDSLYIHKYDSSFVCCQLSLYVDSLYIHKYDSSSVCVVYGQSTYINVTVHSCVPTLSVCGQSVHT